MKPTPSALLAAFTGAALFVLSGTPALRSQLWGFHAWTFLSAAALAGAVLAAAAFGALIYRAPPFPTRWPAVFGTTLSVLPVFWVLHDRTHLLGDGRLWISVLGSERTYHAHEPLAFAAAAAVTRDIGGSAADVLATRLETASVLLGGIAVLLMLRLATHLGSTARERWTILGVLAATGTTQFGFGYIEAYPWFWVSVLLFITAALASENTASRVVEPRSALHATLTALAAGLAAGVHGLGFLLVPALIYRLATDRPGARAIAGAALAWSAPVLFAYLVLPAFMAGEGSRSLPDLFRSSGDVAFASGGPVTWLTEQLNRWWLTAGAAFLLLPAAVTLRRLPSTPGGFDMSKRAGRFLMIAGFSLALPALVLDTDSSRGAAADWDVFAAAAVPLTALVAGAWAGPAGRHRSVRMALAITVAVSFFGTATFVAVNADTTGSVERFRFLASESFRSPRARGWAFETLATFERERGNLSAAADGYVRALEPQPDNPRLIRNAAATLSRSGRSREAAEYLKRLVAVEPDDAGSWLRLGLELEQAGAVDSSIIALRQAVRLEPDSVNPINELARLLTFDPSGRPEAYRLLSRSLRLLPSQPRAADITRLLARLRADGYAREDSTAVQRR